MFASADGFDFKNMTAKPSLTGSDSQDVVFWDARAGGGEGAYVYYGPSYRNFVPGLPHVLCFSSGKALISYQDYHMLLLTLAGRACHRTDCTSWRGRATPCGKLPGG